MGIYLHPVSIALKKELNLAEGNSTDRPPTMSENKPNWIDRANLVSNIAQNAQLHDIHLALSALVSLQAERAASEANARLAEDREDKLRECVWRMENGFKKFVEQKELTPSGAYVIANQISTALQSVGVTSSSFGRFEDKDRLDHFVTGIQKTLSKAGERLTPSQKADVEKYLLCQTEVSELEFLIEHFDREEKDVKARAAVKKLQEIRQEIAQLSEKPLMPEFRKFLGFGAGEPSADQQQRLETLQKKAKRLEEKVKATATDIIQPSLPGDDWTLDQDKAWVAKRKEHSNKLFGFHEKYNPGNDFQPAKYAALKAERVSFLEKFQQDNLL
jgi:hypothetical protein